MENLEKKVILKNNLSVTIKLDKAEDYYTIFAITPKQEKVASLSFRLKNRTCYLNRIEILNPKFSHLGIGTNLIKFMEEFSLMARCNSVDGKFYPFGDLGEYSKQFYIKNGYEIYKDGYETYISKYLKKETEKSF